MRRPFLIAASVAGLLGALSETQAGGPPAYSDAYRLSPGRFYPQHSVTPVQQPRRGVSFYRGPYGDIQTRKTLPFGNNSMSKGYEYIGGMDANSPAPRQDPTAQWEYDFRYGYRRKTK